MYQDAQGNILYANPAAEHILELSRKPETGEIAADPAWKMIREDGMEQPVDQQPMAVALRTGSPVRAVVVGWSNSSSRQARWLQMTVVPLFEAGEKNPSHVYSVFHDITKILETARQAACIQDELRNLEALAQYTSAVLTARLVAVADTKGDETTDASQMWQDCAHQNLEATHRLIEKISALSSKCGLQHS